MLLYHYTNTAGMLGILRTGALWATDVEYLNDSKELLYGRDEVVSALLEEASRLNPDGLGGMTGDDDSSRATIMASAAHSLTEEEHRSYWGPYVACFSEEGDVLSQWRGYAASHGWALGFDLSALRDCVKSWTASESVVHKVVYGPAGNRGGCRARDGSHCARADGAPGGQGGPSGTRGVPPGTRILKASGVRRGTRMAARHRARWPSSATRFSGGAAGTDPVGHGQLAS